jgi:carbon-monoxide dehydrogenase medium subunit
VRPFEYARPETLAQAIALLEHEGARACVLAGGTDLVIRLRDGTYEPAVVVDVKRIPELAPAILEVDGMVRITAGTTMTDVADSEVMQRSFRALVDAARVVGSVQIRNRATLAGNICNGSPAADTAPPLLVYDAVVVVAGPDGTRRMPIDDFIVDSGRVALGRGELVAAIELPVPARPVGSAFVRLTRRRGTDLASITLACAVDTAGVTRLAYGSVGPRALLFIDAGGTLADPEASDEAKRAVLDRIFAAARPSPRSVRASPEYRRAMLPVLGARALDTALARLAEGGGGI